MCAVAHLARLGMSSVRFDSPLRGRAPDPALLERLRAPRETPASLRPRTPARPPDVLLITICTLRPDRLGCLGYDRPTSPRLDALAAEAIVCERAYTPAPKTVYSFPPALAGAHAATFFTAPRRPPDLGALLEAAAGYRVCETVEEALAARGGDRPVFLRQLRLDLHAPYSPREETFGSAPSDRYDAALRELDAELGALIDRFPGAAVAVVSDHGEEFREHGGTNHGFRLYEELLRGVLILRLPGARPARLAEPVSTADLVPTLLEAVGVAELPPSVDAWPLWPRLRGDRPAPRPPIFSATPLAQEPASWRAPASLKLTVIEDDWKLIYDTVSRQVELYDLAADPGERRNRYADAPDRAGRLLEVLATYRRWVADANGLAPAWFE